MDVYEIVRGPLAWMSIGIFLLGSLFRIVSTVRKKHQTKMIYPVNSIKWGIRSIIVGIFPFAASYMRKHPFLAIVTAIFHISLLVVPIALLSHIILWYESWNILWWHLPDIIADIMTICVLLSCLFFLVRRMIVAEVKHITGLNDILLIIIIFIPFLTGFLATHQFGPYRPMLILHILSSELLLIIIPFSKLGHMFLYWFSRGYMGAEYGKVLKAGDW